MYYKVSMKLLRSGNDKEINVESKLYKVSVGKEWENISERLSSQEPDLPCGEGIAGSCE